MSCTVVTPQIKFSHRSHQAKRSRGDLEIWKPSDLCRQRTHGAVIIVVANVRRHVTAANINTHWKPLDGRGQEPPQVITAETLEDRCKRLKEEWTAAERQKMASEYQSYAGVDRVTGGVDRSHGTPVLCSGDHRKVTRGSNG